MDRNSIIGLLLIASILIGYTLYTAPSKEEMAKQKAQQDSEVAMSRKTEPIVVPPVQENKDTVISKADSAGYSQTLGSFATAASGNEEFHYLENNLIKVKISNKGGKVSSVELKKYKTYSGKPLILFEGDSTELGLTFFSQNRTISTNDLFFQSSAVEKQGKSEKLSMRLSSSEGKYLEYLYSLEPDSYTLGFTINMIEMGDVLAANTSYMSLGWKMNTPRQEKAKEGEQIVTTVYYKYIDDEVDYLSETEDEKEVLKTKVKWVAFKQKYFTSVLIAEESFDKPTTIETQAILDDDTHVKRLKAEFTIPFAHRNIESFPMKFYFGPNHYQTLEKYNLELERQIPLGWGIFGWVNKFLVIPIFNFLDGFNMNYGLIILILTIIIKIMLLPLTYKAYISQAKMKVLKPEVDEINSRKGNDPMKSQQEMMALYKKAGVNPLGGCFPMLLQMPILIAMFSFFPAAIELRQQSFLWAEDLSTYDSVLDLGFNIPFYGDHVSLFTLLMTISTLIYTRMNNQFTGANAQMKWISYLMPVIFLGVFNNYSAGLSYYYFLANILTFGQQYLFGKFVDEKAIHLKIQENKKKPSSATKSKFQQRMEEMAKSRGYKPKK